MRENSCVSRNVDFGLRVRVRQRRKFYGFVLNILILVHNVATSLWLLYMDLSTRGRDRR
jgi:hypothetical protein